MGVTWVNYEERVKTSPPVPAPKCCVQVWAVPSWLMPVAAQVLVGETDGLSSNGIGVNADGDVVLYRNFSRNDWLKHPALIGATEVWLEFELPPSD